MEVFLTILKYGAVGHIIYNAYTKHKVAYMSSNAPKGNILMHILLGSMTVALTIIEIVVWGLLTYGIIYLVNIIT